VTSVRLSDKGATRLSCLGSLRAHTHTVTPPGVEGNVKELVRTAVGASGFLSLKYALEQFGQRAVARAIALGLPYDPTTMSLRVTEAALGRG